MERSDAINKIMKDMSLCSGMRSFVENTVDDCGCEEKIDLDTIYVLEQVVRNKMK